MNTLKSFPLIVLLLYLSSFAFCQSFVTQSIPGDGSSSIQFRYLRLFDSNFESSFNGIYDLNANVVLGKRWIIGSSFSYVKSSFINERLLRFYDRIGSGVNLNNDMLGNIGLSAGYLIGKNKNSAFRLSLFFPAYSKYSTEFLPSIDYSSRVNNYEIARYNPFSYNLTSNYSWKLRNESNWLLAGEAGTLTFFDNVEQEGSFYLNFALKFGYKFKTFTSFSEMGMLAQVFDPVVNDSRYFINAGLQVTTNNLQPGLFLMHNGSGLGGLSIGFKLDYRFLKEE
ncbi:MAG: hypothetical protein ACOCXH_11555 [Cyclobacteriaceae bacterium]